MSIFDQLGTVAPWQRAPQAQPMNPMQEMQILRSDPAAYVRKRGYTIPDGMTDPGQITQYLLQSGQVGRQRYQTVLQMAQRFGLK